MAEVPSCTGEHAPPSTLARRLSWGSNSSSRRTSAAGTSRPGTAQPAVLAALQEQQQGTALVGTPTQLRQTAGPHGQTSRKQQPGSSYAGLQQCSASGNTQSCDGLLSQATSMEQTAQHTLLQTRVEVQRAALRAVLAALLQVEDGPCLDHYQLTPQAVAAVAKHQTTEACGRAREEAAGAATAAAKQQLQASYQEAESKAAKQLAEATAKAAAAAAQHSHELAGLQAQLAALQSERRQLFGKSAQQSRNARQAHAAADELQGQLEQARQQLLRQSKQLEGKDAVLARSKLAVHQEVAAAKGDLQQAQAEAAAAKAKHEKDIKRLEAQHAAMLAELQCKLQADAQQQLQHANAAHQQALLQQEQQLAGAAAASLQQLQAELVQVQQHQQQHCQALSVSMAAALDSSRAALKATQQQLQELHEKLAAVSDDAQQVTRFATEQRAALGQVQQQLAEVAPGGLLALQQQAETARKEQQDALNQLQHASSQLATLHAQVLRLQQDKQDVQQQLAAAAADVCSLQQQLAAQAQQDAATQEKLLASQQDQQQLLAAAVEREQTAAAQFLAAEVQAAAAKQEQLERQQQQVQQQVAQVAIGHQHEFEQVLLRLQWLCSNYLSTASDPDQRQPATAPTTGSRPAVEDTINGNDSSAAALAMLCRVCCLAAGDADQLLSDRYEAYQQHKLDVPEDQRNTTPGCESGKGPRDVAAQMQTTSCSAGMGCVQQQMLQLEAGLLQHMLILQEAVQLLQQRQRQQELQQHTPRSQRPSTASSRCTDNCSPAANCSSGSSSMSSNLTGQLLQAMAKDRKQLAQEVKRLQAQQHQQQPGQLRYRRSQSSSSNSWGICAGPAATNLAWTGESAPSRESSDREVDEVLQLLQGYEVQGSQRQNSTPTTAEGADRPPRELQRRGIGSLRSQMRV